MDKMNVAVTGVGGGVGQSIVKSLQNTEYKLIAIDGDPLGAGLYATEKSYLGLYANNPKFINKIIDICRKEDCHVVFPGLDIELIPFAENIDIFKSNEITPIVSSLNVIKIADDKLETSKFLEANGFPYIETYTLEEYNYELGFPIILKPKRGGARSIGTFLIKNQKEFDNQVTSLNIRNYIVQKYIYGDEYTCGTVTLSDKCAGVILMKRQLRSGDTYKAFVIKNQNLSNFVEEVINELKPFGACNIQLRIKDQIPYIFEINARCSGTTASRSLAGFNEPKMICDYLLKGVKNPQYEIKEIAILRYWKELIVTYEQINKIKANGTINNENLIL